MNKSSKKDIWHRHIEECAKSGLSQIEYCNAHDLALSTFGYWKRKLSGNEKSKPVFYPLAISSEPATNLKSVDSGLTLHFKDRGVSLKIEKGFSTATLSQVVAALEQA